MNKRSTLFTIGTMALAAVAMAPRDGDNDEQPGFEVLVAKFGNTVEGMTAMARSLYGENHTERERKRTAKRELTELKTKLPPEGSVVLSKEDAAVWTEWQTLGKPSEVKEKLAAGEKAIGAVAEVEKATRMEKLASVAGYNKDVFGKLATADGLELEEGSVTVDNKAVPVVLVKKADGTRVGIADYAKENWGAFLPSLTAQGGQGNQGGGVAGGGQGGAGGNGAGPLTWPNQGGGAGGGGGEKKDFATLAQDRRDAGTNPLAAPKTT